MSTQTATINYDLTDPDARDAFRLAMDAPRWQSVVWNLDQFIRGQTKHTEPKDWPDAHRIREELHDLMTAEGIEFK